MNKKNIKILFSFFSFSQDSNLYNQGILALHMH